MDFFTHFFGFGLLIVCLVIIVIFLKDYVTGLGNIKKKTGEHIVYEVYYRDKVVQKGSMDMSEIPVQFGRIKGSGNDVVIAPSGVPTEALNAVSRTWFYIERDTAGVLCVYSADTSVNGQKKTAPKAKLLVVNGNKKQAKVAVKLDREVKLQAKDIRMILRVEEYDD